MGSKSAHLLGFVLLLAFAASVASLTPSEEKVLGQIYDSFPMLRALPYSALVAAQEYKGIPWTRDFTSLCTGGSKWAFYGVRCDNDGHIDALHLYVRFLATLTSCRHLNVITAFISSLTHSLLIIWVSTGMIGGALKTKNRSPK